MLRWLRSKPLYPESRPRAPRYEAPPPTRGTPAVRAAWFLGAWAAGFGFGLVAAANPSPAGFWSSPVILLFGFACALLVAVRMLTRRPLTDYLSERALLSGCALCVAAFLLGQAVGPRLFALWVAS